MFGSTSTDIELSGTILNAMCQDSEGDYHNSNIDLDNYISNNEGKLEWGGSSFSQSCSNINLNGTILSATCLNSEGEEFDSSIDLNHYICNNEGSLQGSIFIYFILKYFSAKNIYLSYLKILSNFLKNLKMFFFFFS